MLQDVEHVAAFDVENDLLKTDPAVSLELLVLRVIPSEVFHSVEWSTMCACKAHIVAITTAGSTCSPRWWRLERAKAQEFRRTVEGRLSSRIPTNAECRSSPSAVHSTNPTSTTTVGLTHRIAFMRLP